MEEKLLDILAEVCDDDSVCRRERAKQQNLNHNSR